MNQMSDQGCTLSFSQHSIEKEMRIDVYKGVRTFGLVLVGGVSNQQSHGDSSIYVSKVLEGGLAEVDGRIMPGDRITAVKQFLEDGDAYTFNFDENGSATHEDARQILRRCKGNVALFIVRKDEVLSTYNENESAITNNIKRENSSKFDEINISGCHVSSSKQSDNSNVRIDCTNGQNSSSSCTNKKYDVSNGDKEDLYDGAYSIPSDSSKESCNKAEASKIQLINLAPLRHFRGSQKSVPQPSSTCSMDYREMAKYGIRPGSSLCNEMLQPDYNKIKNHRIKKKWLSNKMSAMSIQEDDEEQFCTSSLSQINNKFELDMEQRVL